MDHGIGPGCHEDVEHAGFVANVAQMAADLQLRPIALQLHFDLVEIVFGEIDDRQLGGGFAGHLAHEFGPYGAAAARYQHARAGQDFAHWLHIQMTLGPGQEVGRAQRFKHLGGGVMAERHDFCAVA